jgi:two-component system, sensor histidine kinase and response regulator
MTSGSQPAYPERGMSDSSGAPSVLVIDDDYAMRLSCGKILAKMGLGVDTFEDGARGVEAVGHLKPDMVVVDLKMPGLSGQEVISRIREIDPSIVIIVITGYATIDTAVQAMKGGAYDFLPKPFSPDELRLIVNRGLERRRLALEAARHEIEQTMLKRRFVTFVSHQLRTPLVAIHQYLDVLRHLDAAGENPVRRQEWLDRCLVRIEELQNLIADWLTLARVEGGSLLHERIKIDLKPVIDGILGTYEQTAAAEGVTLEADLPEGGIFVCGDRNGLNVIFDNLVTNAIKYNRLGGKVVVSGREEEGEVLVTVADNGIGIPEKYRLFLFDEFFRVKDQAKKETAGTGLGLHISKKIVSAMGGAISVASEAGAGSTFCVRLPAWCEPKAEVEAPHDAAHEAHTDCR